MVAAVKRCFRCGHDKPLDEFYAHCGMADGRVGKCKSCAKLDGRRHRRANLKQRREQDRRYSAEPTHRAASIARAAAHNAQHPVETRARKAVSHALRDGKLTRKPCEQCGVLKVEAHHDDYLQPLQVRWLCKEHHEAVHHPLQEAF